MVAEATRTVAHGSLVEQTETARAAEDGTVVVETARTAEDGAVTVDMAGAAEDGADGAAEVGVLVVEVAKRLRAHHSRRVRQQQRPPHAP